MPFSFACRTRMSATGSPPASRGFRIAISAPMSFRILMTPVRVVLMPTCSSVSSEPDAIEAPTIKKAAEEISAGTLMSQAVSRPPPRTQRRAPLTPTAYPKPRSMRSVCGRASLPARSHRSRPQHRDRRTAVRISPAHSQPASGNRCHATSDHLANLERRTPAGVESRYARPCATMDRRRAASVAGWAIIADRRPSQMFARQECRPSGAWQCRNCPC